MAGNTSVDTCVLLLHWVLHLSGRGPVEGCPDLVPVSHAWLEEHACHGQACKVLGWYPGSGNAVYLDDGMDIENNLVHTSIALHEVVHWVQREEGTLGETCKSSVAAEREAYYIQRLFLDQYGSAYPIGSVLQTLGCDGSAEE